jgi:hypothetical protein
LTNDQIQALEALDRAAGGRFNTLVDLERVPVSIQASTLAELLTQGFILMVGRGNFTMTRQGMEKASENRRRPPADG